MNLASGPPSVASLHRFPFGPCRRVGADSIEYLQDAAVTHESFDRLRQTLAKEVVEVLIDTDGRRLQGAALPAGRLYHGGWVQVEQEINEFVRVLGFQAPWF